MILLYWLYTTNTCTPMHVSKAQRMAMGILSIDCMMVML